MMLAVGPSKPRIPHGIPTNRSIKSRVFINTSSSPVLRRRRLSTVRSQSDKASRNEALEAAMEEYAEGEDSSIFIRDCLITSSGQC